VVAFFVVARPNQKALLLSPSTLEFKKKKKAWCNKTKTEVKKKEGLKGGSLPSSSRFGSHFRCSGALTMEFMGPLQVYCCDCALAPSTPKLCSCSNGSQALAMLLSFSNGMTAKSNEVGGREVGRRETFWGREETEKPITLGRGGCVFGSSSKWLQWPHPQLVH
jgi:hypothetical protein